MAYNANGYNAYREIGVKTASQGKLVVMLYEGAVSHIEKAMELIGDEGKIKADSVENFGNHIQKVQDILTELQMSLDMDKGGEIAKNLMALYIFFNKEILTQAFSTTKQNLQTFIKCFLTCATLGFKLQTVPQILRLTCSRLGLQSISLAKEKGNDKRTFTRRT